MTNTTKRHYSTLSLYPRSNISLCSLVSNHSISLTRGTTYSTIKRTHLLSLYEHAQRITNIALRTMSSGSKKQAMSGSLPNDNFAPELVRVLRTDCLLDKKILEKQALIDSCGVSLYNLPNKDAMPTGKYFAGFSVAYSIDQFADYSDTITSIDEAFTDSMDIVHEAVLAMLEIDSERCNKPYFVITDSLICACLKSAQLDGDMFITALKAVHRYIHAQKRKPARKTVSIESYGDSNTGYNVLQYYDIDNTTDYIGVAQRAHDNQNTDKKYIGFMSAYEILQKELTSTQNKVLKGLLRGEQYKLIARKIYGKEYTDKDLYAVKNNVRAIRKVASEILTENSESVLSVLYDRETKKVKLDTIKFTSAKRTISFIDAINEKKVNTVVSTDTGAILDKTPHTIPAKQYTDIRADKNEHVETWNAKCNLIGLRIVQDFSKTLDNYIWNRKAI